MLVRFFTFALIELCNIATTASPITGVLCSHPAADDPSNCLGGDATLLGARVQLGLHSCGSFGVSAAPPDAVKSGALGAVADFDENGFDVYSYCDEAESWYYYYGETSICPMYSGDFITPGNPIEGWALQWNSAGQGIRRHRMFGLLNIKDTFIEKHFQVTSSETTLSVLWQGIVGPLEVTAITTLGIDSLYLTTRVKLRNIGGTTLTDVYYERTVDPDNEVEAYWSTFATRNYVKFQPIEQTTLIVKAGSNYTSAARPRAALVASRGVTKEDFYLSLGAVSPNARVAHNSLYFNPDQIFEDTRWLQYGGSDTLNTDIERMKSIDENLHVVFKYDSIGSGEVVQPQFFYALALHREEEAMDSLDLLSILQPVYSIGGPSVLLSIHCRVDMRRVEFAVFGANSRMANVSAWHDLGAVADCKAGGTANILFDSSVFSAGLVQICAKGYPIDPGLPLAETHSAAHVCSTSSKLVFNVSPQGADVLVSFLNGHSTTLTLNVNGPDGALPFVSFFRDVFIRGQLQTILIGTASSPPFAVTVSVSDLQPGTPLFVRALSSYGAEECSSSATISGLVVKDNLAPTDISLTTAHVRENAAIGSIIGTFSATDPDNSSTTMTFSLLDDAAGAFTIINDTLVVHGLIDYEITTTLSLRVHVDDGSIDNCCYEKSFVIFVEDVNEAPVGVLPLTVDVPEDTPVGTVIATFVAVDPDIDQSASFFFLTPVAELSVDARTGEVVTTAALDHELRSVFELVLHIVDSGLPSMSLDILVVFNVLNVNEGPGAVLLHCVPSTCSVAENTPVGTVIGHLTADHEDEGNRLTFTLSGSAGGLFSVNESSGDVSVSAAIDYESIGAKVEITAVATDLDGLFSTATMTIIVLNVLEPPYAEDIICFVREDRGAGDTVTAVAGGVSSCTMGVLRSEGGHVSFQVADVAANESIPFDIQSCSGIFFVTGDIDYELQSEYNITVVVGDDAGAYLAHALIYVTDVNEPPVLSPIDAVTVEENSPVGTTVGNPLVLSVTDEDCANVGTIRRLYCGPYQFSITGGSGAEYFRFRDPATGQLEVSSIGLNYEAANAFTLQIRVRDVGDLSDDIELLIHISDVNERPRLTYSDGIFASFPEHSAAGSLIGLSIYASDEDIGQSLEVSLLAAGNFNDAFSLERVDDSMLGYYFRFAVRNSSAVDFEVTPVFHLVVEVQDNGIPQLSANQSYTVILSDVNEAPRLPETMTCSILENSTVSSVVGIPIKSVWSDPDIGDTAEFSIVDYKGDTGRMFAIDSFSGIVTLRLAQLSYEYVAVYTYVIRVLDKGGLEARCLLTINVLDVKEPPVFDEEHFVVQIAENIPQSHHFPLSINGQEFVFRATDDDKDHLIFTVVSLDGVNRDAHKFYAVQEVGSVDSAIVVANTTLNYEQMQTHSLTLCVSDGYFNVFTIVEVIVLDANDAPLLPPNLTCYVPIDAVVGSEVCSIVGFDEDAASGSPWGKLEYSLHTNKSSFGIRTSNNIGYLVYGGGELTEHSPVELMVAATDGGGLSASTTVTVIPIPVNAPPRCPLQPMRFDLLENSVAATSVGRLLGGQDPARFITADSNGLIVHIVGGNERGMFNVNSTDGLISVAVGAKIDYETISAFVLVVSAIEITPYPLSVSCYVFIDIIDVNEPTTFLDHEFSCDENIAAGILSSGNVPIDRIKVIDEDPADQHGLFSLSCVSCGDDPIAVDEFTGELYLKRHHSLDFETLSRYEYDCMWLSRGISKQAKVVVYILDIPEAPIVQNLHLRVDEGDAAVIVGAVVAYDPDFDGILGKRAVCRDQCGLIYSIESGWPSVGQFTVDALSGVISVGFLDFENIAAYELIIRVVDAFGMSNSGTIFIKVRDKPDCAITSVVGKLGVQLSDAPTVGGSDLIVHGLNFGPTKRRLKYEEVSHVLTAWLQNGQTESLSSYFYELPCTLNRSGIYDNTMLTCVVPPGVGTELAVVVSVISDYADGNRSLCKTSLSIGKVSYAHPEILSVTSDLTMPTRGGFNVAITGLNFGPASTSSAEATYWNDYMTWTVACDVIIDQTSLLCPVGPGIGGNLSWIVHIGGLSSNSMTAGSFGAPVITSVSSVRLSTGGGDTFEVRGSNFGNSKESVEVLYGTSTKLEYRSSVCDFAVAHEILICQAVAGVGGHLKVLVNVGGLSSAVYQSVDLAYATPNLTLVLGPGAVAARTTGGGVVYLIGSNFGPVGLAPEKIVVTYSKLSNLARYAASSCQVTSDNVQIECRTAPGTGAGLVWSVSVGGQMSPLAATKTSYSPPMITAYAGEGAVAARTDGNDTIIITGHNFGPSMRTVQEVSYHAFNRTKFIVTDSCRMVVAHHSIRCLMAPGAGKQLSWFRTVDEQRSVAPTSSYAAPIIYAVSGPQVSNGSVFGGDLFYISGDNFGPSNAHELYGIEFLESITYGPSGTEYSAAGCQVLSSKLISCLTVRGVGGSLAVRIVVGGQVAHFTSATFGYAIPVLLGLSPMSVSTDGTVVVKVSGDNLGIFSSPILLFDGAIQVVTYVSDSEIEFRVPEVSLQRKAVGNIRVSTGGQSSNVLELQYRPPFIRGVSVGFGRTRNNTYTVVISGDSFSLHPAVLQSDALSGVKSYLPCDYASHKEINCLTTAKKGTIAVIVGGRVSNVKSFEFGPPRVLIVELSSTAGATTAGWSLGHPAVLTITGQHFGDSSAHLVVSMESTAQDVAFCNILAFRRIEKTFHLVEWMSISATVEGEDTELAFEQIDCALPPGQGSSNSVKVTRGSSTSLGCGCRECTKAACFSYPPPSISSLAPLTGSTLGQYTITLFGENFGISPNVYVGNKMWSVERNGSSHTELILLVPAGEGRRLPVRVETGGLTSAAAQDVSFAYGRPTIESLISSIVAGSGGSFGTFTLFGSNFGVLGPLVKFGEIAVPVSTFDHDFVSFFIPPGQGKDIIISINVSGQLVFSLDFFAYTAPSVLSVQPLSGGTEGGRMSGILTTITGSNFGVCRECISLQIGDFSVRREDIISFSSEEVVFFAPEGVGTTLLINLVVEGQGNIGDAFFYSYDLPVIEHFIVPDILNTAGGDLLVFHGRSLGTIGAVVTVQDPLARSAQEGIHRMPISECRVITQEHMKITCHTPPGAGRNLIIKVSLAGSLVHAFPLDYGLPKISHLYHSRGGDAAGGELMKIYGTNFGAFRTPVNVSISGAVCSNAAWLVDDPLWGYQPYLQCTTPRMMAGIKNISVTVAFQPSSTPLSSKVSCKAGWFGRAGEYCSKCGEPAITGLLCDKDNMNEPYAPPGFYIQQVAVPSDICSPESQTIRSSCPASLACLPKEACDGNNTCGSGYEGTRCGTCADGFFKINGECQSCPNIPWVIPLVLLGILLVVCCVARQLKKKNAHLSILSIAVDYLQVLSVFATIDIAWPETLVWLFNAASSVNMNVDVLAADCYNDVNISYREKWYGIAGSPIFVFALGSGVCILGFAILKRQRYQALWQHLLGGYVTLFNFVYLMLSRNSLAVFNCQATEPSDGSSYMVDVGPDGGLCYVSGTMQQELQPWAGLTLGLYCVGFPICVAFMLHRFRLVAVSDQLMKAARRAPRNDVSSCARAFRNSFRRMYSDFKPDTYYWSLVILARKFALSISAVVFRENVVFLLAIYLLILFLSYYAQVKFSPYMPPTDYEEVLRNDEIISESDREELLKCSVTPKKMRKRAMLGAEGDLLGGAVQTVQFFNNYNTVESYLLMSTILLAITGLMFESGQLSPNQHEWMSKAVVMLLLLSLCYVAYVLLMEFVAPTPLCSCLYHGIEQHLDIGINSPKNLDVDTDMEFGRINDPPEVMQRKEVHLQQLQMQFESSNQIIEQQKAEIERLKRGEYATASIKNAFSRGERAPARTKLKKKVDSCVFEQINPLNTAATNQRNIKLGAQDNRR